MALVNLTEVLNKAKDGGYAVPAITFYTLEDLRAIMRACVELKSPIILMNGPRTFQFTGMKHAAFMGLEAAVAAPIPVVLHLDHAVEEKMVLEAIHHGFTSVMFDGSHLPFEENVERTSFVVRAAGHLGVSVEGEIGRLSMGEEGEFVEQVLTEPDTAATFEKETGVDAVAVAVGTAHGMQSRDARLNFELMDILSRRLTRPIVLHGSSGVSDADLVKAVSRGICKVNIATRVKFAFINRLREFFDSGEAPKDHLQIFEYGMNAQVEEVKSVIRVLGSEGRA